jgi:hypothetical protein
MSKSVRVSLEQTDGRVSMSLSGLLSLHVETPRNEPLSNIETQATIVVSDPKADPDNRAEIELDAEALDHLVDELHAAQTGDAYE